MRILIDECLPRKLKRELPEHDTYTVAEMGWSGTKNGALLKLMANDFDVLVTIDQNLKYQQNLQGATVAVLQLSALSNRLKDLLPLIPQLKEVLKTIQAGEVVTIRGNTTS
jgi:predicted nuclease of predicted toxin-antitoxin system